MEPNTRVAAMDQRPTLRIAIAAAAGVALSAGAAAITLAGTGSAAAAVGRGLMVAVPVGVGLYTWRRRPEQRSGPLLVAVGGGWSLTTLAELDDELPYSVGRIAGWLVEASLIYLILSFPHGGLRERVDRLLFGASLVLVAALYLPSVPVVEDYPVPTAVTSCREDCPGNAFFALDSQPAVIDSVFRPLREVLTILLFVAVTARLAGRVHRATPLMRRTLGPVLLVAGAHLLTLAGGVSVRLAAPDSPVAEALAWAVALALPVLAASFLVGLLRWRLFIADALPRLGSTLHPNIDAEELRAAFADALGDPHLQLAYWVELNGGRWVDAAGNRVELPREGSGRCVAEVYGEGRRIAALIYDEALRDQRDLIDGAAAYARIALENQRLSAKVESSLREIAASRTRLLTLADEERRRIERDLHDGAQQRLVAMRIKLELAEELVAVDVVRGVERLHALGVEVDETLEEIRSLARGVYPSLLADRGLAEALSAAALRSPTAASVSRDGVGRYPPPLENAVYFCCLEALQNASKHAEGASVITISLVDDGALRFEVRDDGEGFDVSTTEGGAGLRNMRDRVEAVGGELTIESAPGRGAVVAGTVPLAPVGADV